MTMKIRKENSRKTDNTFELSKSNDWNSNVKNKWNWNKKKLERKMFITNTYLSKISKNP